MVDVCECDNANAVIDLRNSGRTVAVCRRVLSCTGQLKKRRHKFGTDMAMRRQKLIKVRRVAGKFLLRIRAERRDKK